MRLNSSSIKQVRIGQLFLACFLFILGACNYDNELELYFKNTPKEPVSTGLIAYFSLDSGIVDVSGNNTPVILKGNPVPVMGIDKVAGSALKFDRQDNWLMAFIGLHDTLAISLWFKTNAALATQVNKSPGLLDYGAGSFSTSLYHVDATSAATYLHVKVDSLSNPRIETNWLYIPYHEWQHLVVQFAKGGYASAVLNIGRMNSHFYRKLEFPISTVNPLADVLYIARDATGQKYFQGSIDEVKIFSRLLTDEEIMSLYQERK